MDFESQNSDLKSTENIVPDSSATTSIGDVKIESNGSNAHEDVYDLHTNGNGCSEKLKEEAAELNCNDHENVDAVTADSLINSGTKGAEDDLKVTDSCVSPSGMLSPISGMKGQGLRKWRRIRREFINNGTHSKDSAKILKRGSADLVNPSVVKVEMKQKSDGSESSVNGILHKIAGSSTGSDEDRDSKSSTAASIPKPGNDIPRPSRDKDKTKHMSEKQFSKGPQPLHQGAGNIDSSKKPRGEAVNMDKENSLLSHESDSGSYCYVSMHCPSSGTNNVGSDRGTCDREQHSDEEVPTGTGKSVEDEEISKGGAVLSWKVRGREKNDQMSGNWDPLVDCVQTLQCTQEVLEREIQKFCELGKDLRPFDDDLVRTSSVGPESCVPSSTESPTSDFGTEIPDVLISLTKNIEMFEKQIEETKGMLRAKETKITQLQATVNNLTSSNEDLQRSIDIQQKKYEEIDAEVDNLYKEKMEAEIQYLAIADMSFVAENQMKFLLTKQKSLVSAQAQELQKVENLECKAAKLKDKAQKGGMQKGIVAKFTFCFIIQLILFFCVLDFFISHFLFNTNVVLPT